MTTAPTTVTRPTEAPEVRHQKSKSQQPPQMSPKVKKRREMAVRAANDAPAELEVIEVGKEEKEGSAKKEAEEKSKVEKKNNQEKEMEEKKVEDVISLDLNELESGEEDMCSRAAHLGKVRSALWESVLTNQAELKHWRNGRKEPRRLKCMSEIPEKFAKYSSACSRYNRKRPTYKTKRKMSR
uniref:Uncharacterized protein n=1 Tax=Globodera rostochiensis TaxID=31243 RepID=A0A914HFM2_GLORO